MYIYIYIYTYIYIYSQEYHHLYSDIIRRFSGERFGFRLCETIKVVLQNNIL